MVDRMVESARRVDGVPVRRGFVQFGAQDNPTPGPAHAMLRAHDENAFDLFLLHRAQASMEPWDVVRHGRLWATSLGLPTPKDDGATAVSRTWARLEKNYQLVTKERAGRLLRSPRSTSRARGSRTSTPGEGPVGAATSRSPRRTGVTRSAGTAR